MSYNVTRPRVFAPAIQVTIKPIALADSPNIEKTHRQRFCPPWELPLIQAAWPRGKAELAINRDWRTWSVGQAPLRAMRIGLNQPDEIETERARLRAVYRRLFDETFPVDARGDAFRDTVMKHMLTPKAASDLLVEVRAAVDEHNQAIEAAFDLFGNLDESKDNIDDIFAETAQPR